MVDSGDITDEQVEMWREGVKENPEKYETLARYLRYLDQKIKKEREACAVLAERLEQPRLALFIRNRG